MVLLLQMSSVDIKKQLVHWNKLQKHKKEQNILHICKKVAWLSHATAILVFYFYYYYYYYSCKVLFGKSYTVATALAIFRKYFQKSLKISLLDVLCIIMAVLLVNVSLAGRIQLEVFTYEGCLDIQEVQEPPKLGAFKPIVFSSK